MGQPKKVKLNIATFVGAESWDRQQLQWGGGRGLDGGGGILAIQAYPRTIPADQGGMSAAIVTFQPVFRIKF